MRNPKKAAASAVLVSCLFAVPLGATEDTWVPAGGNVQLADGTPLCAMVLANGQYMFSCDGTGSYDLGVPLDTNGQITLFCFADGFAPYSAQLGPGDFPFTVFMHTALPGSPLIRISREVACAGNNRVRVSGAIESSGGDPLCAMVLANGQQMFTCSDSPGRYDLTVPTDGEGNVTLFGFADGFQPYRETFRALACLERYEMLSLVNTARRQGKLCGYEGYFPPTEALTWNDLLAAAALRHSSDMATHDFFSHTGWDDSVVSDRVSDTGYDWWIVGENIAAGYATAAAAMQALLDSPGHCANIMNPSFEEFGAARSDNPDSTYGVYWTQVFGTSW